MTDNLCEHHNSYNSRKNRSVEATTEAKMRVDFLDSAVDEMTANFDINSD